MELHDIESLLAPIEGDNPCGQDLRETSSPDYQTLKDARRAIASLTRSRKFDPEAESEINGHWQTIYKLAPSVLKEQSKDLEVSAWLTEAALKMEGYTGLKSALAITKGLVENFWDNLYPMPDEDGIETRVYSLTGLNGEEGNGTLILPLKNVPLSEDYDQPFTFNLYSRCLEADKLTDPEAKSQRIEDIGMSLQGIQAQVNASSVDFYQNLIADLESSLDSFNQSTNLLDEKCGLADSPPSSGIKKSLEEILEAVKSLTKTKLAAPVADVAEESSAPADGGTAHSGAGTVSHGQVVSGPIATREQALNQLLLVANYFRQTEPHSPLCGALERLVHWGNMSIQELMMQLIPDSSARANFTLLTGIDLGEEATPIGQLSQSARPVETAPPAAEAQEQQPVSNDFGQEENLSGW